LLKRTTPSLQEKLVLFWHDHFATSNASVGDPRLMSAQNRTLRYHARGNMRSLVKDIGRDIAMLEFLNTQQNHKSQPNENYARELLELFTLGVHDFGGNENYRQGDIVQIARAFSGWRRFPAKYKVYFDPTQHDFEVEFPERGPKVVFTETGGFGPAGRAFDDLGEGKDEIDRVVDVIFDHTDSEGQNTVARRTTARLLEYFAHGEFADPAIARPVVDAILAESGFDGSFEITPLLRALFVNDAFYETLGMPPYGPISKRSVKWPVDLVVGTVRMLDIQTKKNNVAGGAQRAVREHVARMGQSLMEPPSVFGWDWENAWINSGGMLARFSFARDVGMARSGGNSFQLRTDQLVPLDLTDPAEIVDAAADVLGIGAELSVAEKNAFATYLTSEGGPPLDLSDEGFRQRKLNGLFCLLLQSPAYQVH